MLGEVLWQTLQIVRNSKPNERGGGCASHNCSSFELSQLLVCQERHDLV